MHLVQEVGLSEYAANIPLPCFRSYAIGTPNETFVMAESLPPTAEWSNRSQDLPFPNSFLLGHLKSTAYVNRPEKTLTSWRTRQHHNMPISMIQCCEGFKCLASIGSGSSYRLKGINLNIFISHSYTPFSTYDITGHDAGLMSCTIQSPFVKTWTWKIR